MEQKTKKTKNINFCAYLLFIYNRNNKIICNLYAVHPSANILKETWIYGKIAKNDIL